jgi:transcriptional regulator
MYTPTHFEGPDVGRLHALIEAHPPWSLSQLEAGLRESLPESIVGLRIPIERLEGKFKLSQTRSAADRVRVIGALRERGGTADLEMALLMEAPPAVD